MFVKRSSTASPAPQVRESPSTMTRNTPSGFGTSKSRSLKPRRLLATRWPQV